MTKEVENCNCNLELMLCVALLLTTIVASVMLVLSVEPHVDPAIIEDCKRCMESQNLSFADSVEAFYWLEVNRHIEPEIIAVKYHIAKECGWNCTIWDKDQELKMITRVQLIHKAGNT